MTVCHGDARPQPPPTGRRRARRVDSDGSLLLRFKSSRPPARSRGTLGLLRAPLAGPGAWRTGPAEMHFRGFGEGAGPGWSAGGRSPSGPCKVLFLCDDSDGV